MRALRLSLASSASRHVKPVLPNARNIRQFSRPSSPVVRATAAVSSSFRSSSSASQPRGLALLAATSSASSARHTRFLKEKECFRRYLASMIAPEEPSSPESTTPYLARTPGDRRLVSAIVAALLFALYGVKTAFADEKEAEVKVDHGEAQKVIEENTNGGEKSEPTWTWRQVWDLIADDWWLFALAIAAAFGASVFQLKMQKLVGVLIDTTKGGAGFAALSAPMMLFGAFVAAEALLGFTYYALVTIGCENMAYRLRQRIYNSILHQDIAFFDDTNSGEMLARLSGDVDEVRRAVKYAVSDGIRNSVTMVGGIYSLYTISPHLTAIICITVPVLVVVGNFYGSFLRRMSRRAQNAKAVSFGVSSESIQNIRTVRSFANEDKEAERYRLSNEENWRYSTYFGISMGLFSSMTQVAVNGIALGVLGYGGYLVSLGNGTLTAGALTSFLVTSLAIQRSLGKLAVLGGKMSQGFSALDRISTVTNKQPSIPLRGGKTLPHSAVKGRLEFRNVTFHYPNRKKQKVFNSLNLEITEGQVLSLVGHSGAGKSTVSALIQRFYDPEQGGVFLDGVDIREYDPTWLRSQIGVVSQEPVLFQTSILENIAYGKPDATPDEVIAAAKKANCHDFITAFPDGYETKVGERGLQLSGGQKQRVAIARALLRDPKILILDEATSALDATSEKLVQEAMATLMKDRTVIIIAHRLSTIRDADQIVVLDQGKVIEKGSHDQLMGTVDGEYRNLVEKQLEKKFKL